MSIFARAIIVRDNKLLAIKRNKFGDQYYTLIGGEVEPGETPEQAIIREVKEEASITIKDFRKVFIQAPIGEYGEQHIFLCKDPGGDIVLSPASPESMLNSVGKNTYHPVFLPFAELPSVNFLSQTLQKRLIDCQKNGFPDIVEHI